MHDTNRRARSSHRCPEFPHNSGNYKGNRLRSRRYAASGYAQDQLLRAL